MMKRSLHRFLDTPVNEDRTTYYIYSMNPDGRLMADRGQPFVLSNS